MDGYPSFTLDQSLVLGNERIDASHKYMMFLLKKALAATDSCQPNPEIDDLLCACIEYTAVHFLHEENLMATTRYPNIREHMRDHTRFYEGAHIINQSLHDRHRIVISWISEYCAEHINKHDRILANYIRTCTQGSPECHLI